MKNLALLCGLVVGILAYSQTAAQIKKGPQSGFVQRYPCILASGKQATSPSKRGFFLGPARFRPQDIAFARADFDQYTNEPVVLLGFTAPAAKRVGYLTKKMVGQQLPIFLDGDLVTCPRVNEPIEGGQIQLSGNLTLTTAAQLAAKVKGASK
jgi:preprotein translocase subunit SecD